MRSFFVLLLVIGLTGWWLWPESEPDWPNLSDTEWRQRLDEKRYHILREGGTEPAHSGQYAKPDEAGTFLCAGCGHKLFSSQTQYDSGTGWPSFFQPLNQKAVAHHQDNTFVFAQIEVRCGRCQGHLGHVFPDGPKPTGLRYCINSLALELDR